MDEPPDEKLPRDWKHTPNGVTTVITICVLAVLVPAAIMGGEPGLVWGAAILIVIVNAINLARIKRARRRG